MRRVVLCLLFALLVLFLIKLHLEPGTLHLHLETLRLLYDPIVVPQASSREETVARTECSVRAVSSLRGHEDFTSWALFRLLASSTYPLA